MKLKLVQVALALLCGLVGPVSAVVLPDLPAPRYCSFLADAGFGSTSWSERIGGCAGEQLWPADTGSRVANYVYRVPGSKNVLQLVSLIAKPGKAKETAGRKALAAAATAVANSLSMDSAPITRAVLAGRKAVVRPAGWMVQVDATDSDLLSVQFWSQKALDAECAELGRTKCD